MSIFEFLKPSTYKSQARQREKQMDSRMGYMLKMDLETFKQALEQLGLDPGDEEYEKALKVWNDAR